MMYSWAIGLTIVTTSILIWLSLGVGIIGEDGDPANRLYFGVVAAGIVGAILSQLKPGGMAMTLLAMAIAQTLVAVIALIGGLGRPFSGPAEIILLNGFFVVMFSFAAWLFRRAIPIK